MSVLPESGAVRVVQVGSHRIGLFRVGDEVHAVADRCPHRGAPLCSGGRTVHGIEVDEGVPVRGAERALVRCPWHKWDFDIASGRCLVHPTLRVRRYRVTFEDEHVIVHLEHPDPNAGGARRAS